MCQYLKRQKLSSKQDSGDFSVRAALISTETPTMKPIQTVLVKIVPLIWSVYHVHITPSVLENQIMVKSLSWFTISDNNWTKVRFWSCWRRLNTLQIWYCNVIIIKLYLCTNSSNPLSFHPPKRLCYFFFISQHQSILNMHLLYSTSPEVQPTNWQTWICFLQTPTSIASSGAWTTLQTLSF